MHVLVGTAVHVHFVVLLHLEHLSTHHPCFVVQKWCKACVLLEGLNRGLPKLGIGRSRGLNNDHTKGAKESNGTKSFESKQCGTLDFWCSRHAITWAFVNSRWKSHLMHQTCRRSWINALGCHHGYGLNIEWGFSGLTELKASAKRKEKKTVKLVWVSWRTWEVSLFMVLYLVVLVPGWLSYNIFICWTRVFRKFKFSDHWVKLSYWISAAAVLVGLS